MNSALVLRLLRSGSPLSRAELSRNTSLSEGTVSRIVAELIERGLVVEDGAENSTGGRPATRLRLSGQRLALGVDIASWETRFAVGTIAGQIVDSARDRTPPAPEKTLALVASRFRSWVAHYGPHRLDRVGISVSGIVNIRKGVVETGHNPRWLRIPVREYLESALGVPVSVENNVRAAAIAEHHQSGLGLKNSRCLLYVLVDEGVGVGILLDGKLYHGPNMGAGEFGQMVIAFDDGPERHDRPGSLEQLVSNSAIADRYAGQRASGAPRDSAARVRRICQAALAGEPKAITTLQVTCRYLGVAIANLVWGLDPDTIVISSVLNTVWPRMREWITGQFPPLEAWPTFGNLRILPSALGESGPLIGAALLPFSQLFESGELEGVAGVTQLSAG